MDKKGLLTGVTYSGGSLTVAGKAKAQNYTWSGTQVIAGGTASGASAALGGVMLVSSGTVTNTTVASGGKVTFVGNAASATKITMSSGGMFHSGSTAENAAALCTLDDQGSLSTVAYSSGAMVVGKGAKASSFTLSRAQHVSAGGKILAVTVGSGGALTVGKSGTASGVTLTSGTLTVTTGGTVTDLAIGMEIWCLPAARSPAHIHWTAPMPAMSRV